MSGKSWILDPESLLCPKDAEEYSAAMEAINCLIETALDQRLVAELCRIKGLIECPLMN